MSYSYCKARVRETTRVEGSDVIADLLGAPSGYQSFWQAFGQSLTVAQDCYYAIVEEGGEGWEYGLGEINNAGQLDRQVVIATGYSSFGGSRLSLLDGTKHVYSAIPPEAVHMRGDLPLPINDTTPFVLGGNVFVEQNSSSTTITAFDNGIDGKVLTIIFTSGNTTIQHNSNIKLSGGSNFVGTANDVIRLIRIGSVWYEKSRSVNA